MASFPTSPHTFTQFANGALSDAAQITDAYGEIEAIENGLLGGTARLNSSNSTLANLSVPGGSTFAARPTMPPPEAVRVRQSVTPLANNSTTAVTWPTQDFATNSSLHSTGTNAERLIPQSTGIFVMVANVSLPAVLTPGSTQFLLVAIEDSSGAILGRQTTGDAGATAPSVTVNASKRFDVTGSWVRVVALQASGSTQSVEGSLGFFHMYKL